MNKKNLKYTVIKDGKFFVAKATEIELTNQGKYRDEAIKNLHEAYELLTKR